LNYVLDSHTLRAIATEARVNHENSTSKTLKSPVAHRCAAGAHTDRSRPPVRRL